VADFRRNKEKGGKMKKNGKENKEKMFLLPFLRKQRLGC